MGHTSPISVLQPLMLRYCTVYCQAMCVCRSESGIVVLPLLQDPSAAATGVIRMIITCLSVFDSYCLAAKIIQTHTRSPLPLCAFFKMNQPVWVCCAQDCGFPTLRKARGHCTSFACSPDPLSCFSRIVVVVLS